MSRMKDLVMGCFVTLFVCFTIWNFINQSIDGFSVTSYLSPITNWQFHYHLTGKTYLPQAKERSKLHNNNKAKTHSERNDWHIRSAHPIIKDTIMNKAIIHPPYGILYQTMNDTLSVRHSVYEIHRTRVLFFAESSLFPFLAFGTWVWNKWWLFEFEKRASGEESKMRAWNKQS